MTDEDLSIYRASRDEPKLKAIAIEHLELCRAHVQRTAGHAIGEGDALTDVQLLQASESLAIGTEHVNRLLQSVQEDKKANDVLVREIRRNALEASKKNITMMSRVGGWVAAAIMMIYSIIVN